MKPPFVVFALPRSRTAWLSRFLTAGDWYCGHEELRHARTSEDVKAWLSLPNTGTVETAGAPWWRTLRKYRPDANVVVVHRPVGEVIDSLMRLDTKGAGSFDRRALSNGMEHHAAKLRQISARWPNALSVEFSDLADEETGKAIYEHCLPYEHERTRWKHLSRVNIQCSMPHLIRYVEAFRPQMEKLATVTKFQTIADLRSSRVSPPIGVTLQVEPFETFIRDARGLIADHLVKVGERPDNVDGKNLPLMQVISDMGNMQIVTARSNGRMFGYLMTILSPSLEAHDLKTAIETTFYASDDIPGLGMKMQRFSLEKLRESGRADEIFFRAGPRGSGPRMGAIYKRLGALPDGELYRLNLRAN